MKKPQPDKAIGTGVSIVEVAPDTAGQRIDNFLMARLKGVPKSRVYRLLRKGEVRVNGGRIKAEYKLKGGDKVRIPPVRVAERPDKPISGSRERQRLDDAVLYEDERLLVLNKPAGMAVHGGSGISLGVIETLRQMRPDAHFLELVHRLDRDTSGCLMVAKRRSALRSLQEIMRNNEMDKRYLALVAGVWDPTVKVVDAPLRKNTLKGGERVVKVDPEGKPSESRVRIMRSCETASLIEVHLITGRTHQIRVHCQYEGHPIAGDEKYGDEAFNRAMREMGGKRLFLHARSLKLSVPWRDSPLQVTAPMDKPLNQLIDRVFAQ